jgi:hypothetical protein
MKYNNTQFNGKSVSMDRKNHRKTSIIKSSLNMAHSIYNSKQPKEGGT